MNTRLLKTIGIVLTLLLASACDTEPPVTREQAVVAVIADSIGNGYGLAIPWPALLSKELQKPIINISVSGMETGWGLDVVDGILATHKPTHLLISLGSNDAVRGPSDAVAVANIQEMARRAARKNIIVIVGNVIPNLYSPEADAHAQIINQGLAELDGVIIVDNRTKMKDGKGLLADGVHPNQLGQQMLADAFLEAFNSSFTSK